MNLDRVIAVRNNKTIYRDGDRCVKVFHAEYTKAEVLSEALNQARMEEIDLRVPRIIEVSVNNGNWAIVSEYIKGKSLDLEMNENPERKEAHIDFFVELQMRVHSSICPLLVKLEDELQRNINASGLDEALCHELSHRLDAMPEHDNVCHGDFNPTNIIVTEEGMPYVLDWSHATRGNTAADAAQSYLLLGLSGDMDGAERYLDSFCKKTGTAKQSVQWWLPVVAAARFGRSNESEREFLTPWLTL